MEMHYNNPIEDPVAPTVLDFHRFVLLVSHRFTDRIHFFGEVELEQAFVDILVTPEFNFRAGMMLAPIGITNERHEPPTFYGVERPFVDTFIIPTTWFDVGGGIHCKLRYRLFVMAPLDSVEFSA